MSPKAELYFILKSTFSSMKKQSLFTLLAILLLAACAAKLNSSSPLFATDWVLFEMNGNPVQVSGTSKDARLHFEYKNSKLTGSGGCNQLAGTFEADKEEMEFGPIAATRMSCVDQAFEDRFLETLKAVRFYQIENDRLILKDDRKKHLLVFRVLK
jgi:heat shock protein HslJ